MALTKKKKIVLIAVPVLAVFIADIVLTTVYFCTQNEALDFVEIPVVRLDEKYLSTVENNGNYLGHPDLVLTDDGTLYCAYPAGHGKGDKASTTAAAGQTYQTLFPTAGKNRRKRPPFTT